jgi:chemotaxis protein methyltransferase CheR
LADNILVSAPSISDADFKRFSDLMFELSGIYLSPQKKFLLVSRLGKRLRHYGLTCFSDYFTLATQVGNERERADMLNLLTTNETYFFREHKHLDFLRDEILPTRSRGGSLRIWSAAASTGEEAYSVAMVLADVLGLSADWSIVGTDINDKVLEQARDGRYAIESAKKIPDSYLRQYCLRGVGDAQGYLLVDPSLRAKLQFNEFNLNSSFSSLDKFDVIFLRNVMIYFDKETRKELVAKMYQRLRPGGHLIVGHSETLNEINKDFKSIKPSIYRRAD